MNEELKVKISASLEGLEASLNRAKKKFDKFNQDVESSSRKLEKIGLNMTKAITVPLLAVGGIALASAAKFEKMEAALVTAFNGSEEAAKDAQKTIIDFAAKTPFAVGEITDAFLKLKNLGLDPSERALTSYGNTAAAMGKSLNQMVEAVADASTNEFERLKEFGIKAKQNADSVEFTFKGVTTTVAKNSEAIQNYLLNIGEVDFAGGIERQSKTFSGVVSTMKDNIALAFKDVGDVFLPLAKSISERITEMTAAFRALSPEAKTTIVVLGGIVALIPPLITGIGFLGTTVLPMAAKGVSMLATALGRAGKAMKAFNLSMLANPIVLVGAAIAGLTYAFVSWAQSFTPILSKWNTFVNLLKSGGSLAVFQSLQIADAAAEIAKQNKAALDASNDYWGAEAEKTIAREKQLKVEKEAALEAARRAEAIRGTSSALDAEISRLETERSVMAKNNTQWQEYADKIQAVKNQLYTLQSGGSNVRKAIVAPLQGVLAEIAPITDMINTKVQSIIPTKEQMTEKQVAFLESWISLRDAMQGTITNALTGTIADLGYAIGDAIVSGANVLQAAGQVMLSAMGKLLGTFGEMVLAYGIANMALFSATKSAGNPISAGAAIAAGAALMVISGAIGAFSKKNSQKMESGSFSGASGGGTYSGSGSSYSGSSGGSGGFGGSQRVVFDIAGRKLIGVIQNELRANKSLGGTIGLTT